MKHAFGEGDTGTWKITDNLVLELNGTKKQYYFDLVKLDGEKIGLHPFGTPPDSILDLREKFSHDYESEEEWDNRITDSVRVADSMAYAEAIMEAEMAAIEEQNRLDIVGGTWMTVPKGEIRLTFNTDGTLLYQEGKKKYNGTWQRSSHPDPYKENYLTLTFNGREQIVKYRIMEENYDDNSHVELSLTFIPTGSKKLETFLLQRTE